MLFLLIQKVSSLILCSKQNSKILVTTLQQSGIMLPNFTILPAVQLSHPHLMIFSYRFSAFAFIPSSIPLIYHYILLFISLPLVVLPYISSLCPFFLPKVLLCLPASLTGHSTIISVPCCTILLSAPPFL